MLRLVKAVPLSQVAVRALITCQLIASTVTVVCAQAQASDPSTSAFTGPPTGTTFDAANLSAYEQILPAAAQLAIMRGFPIRIAPTERDASGIDGRI